MHSSFMWMEPMVADLRQLWDENLPASRIAAVLSERYGYSYSRCSILGKVHRLGDLPARKVGRQGVHPPRVKKFRAKPVFTPRIRPPEVEPEPLGYRLWEVPQNGCMYPHGNLNYTFCGRETIDKSSYCAYHYSVCYLSSRYKRRPDTSLGAQGALAVIPPTIAGAPV